MVSAITFIAFVVSFSTSFAFTFPAPPSTARSNHQKNLYHGDAVSFSSSNSHTELNLFGKKDSTPAAENKGPVGGMMENMNMLKQAQQLMAKKQTVEKELAKVDHFGTSENGKVKTTAKYIVPLPMQQAGYDIAAIDIDEEFIGSASNEELNAAIEDSINAAFQSVIAEVSVKMQALAADISAMQAPPAK